MPRQRLSIHPDRYTIVRLDSGSTIPVTATAGPFFAVVGTPDERSVVCREMDAPEGERREDGWRLLGLVGPFEFTAVGVLASVLQPLADAGIPILAVSTFDTDYVLVKEENLDRAVVVLRRAGHLVFP